MKIKMILLVTILSITAQATCQNDYQYIKGVKMMSNCRWTEHITNENNATTFKESIQVSSDYDFSRTYIAESHNKFDAVNRDDVGRGMSLGIVQFNSRYAKELSKHLGIKSWMSTKKIKRKLRTKHSKEIQLKMFNRAFVKPVLKFAYKKNITDKKIIEFLVDWRVNGMPKKYYKKITSSTTIEQLVTMRNNRYYRLHRSKPKKYTRRILKHWLKRSNSFLV